MAPIFAPLPASDSENACLQATPPRSIQPSLETGKRQRSESQSDDPRPLGPKQRRVVHNLPSSGSPSLQFGFGYTPTSSIAPSEKNEVYLTEPGNCSVNYEVHQANDAQTQNSRHEREQPPLGGPTAEAIEKLDDLDDWDVEINEEGKILTHTRVPDHGDIRDPFSISEWDFDEKTLDEIMEGFFEEKADIPSSSVIRAYDSKSRSAEEFDPNLQHSSPSFGSRTAITDREDKPLEKDVDWAPVHECTQTMQKQGTSIGLQETRKSSVSELQSQYALENSTNQLSRHHLTLNGALLARMSLKPHKTFFHIQEMLNAKAKLFKNQPEAIFELVARVGYSSRENFHHKQYFQFRSLLNECPPYINGKLIGYQVGGPLDCASQAFLQPSSKGTKCVCRCKLRPSQESDVKWFVLVLDIAPLGWREIRIFADRLGRNDLDQPTASG
ncbi:hypothetical protein BGZ63DRAFT_439154 [Mariannaea sp. PMI_226]|nr:hypothetical protein BGZ63DRAFT_439154 [Mariannaea sp. PMI_226]